MVAKADKAQANLRQTWLDRLAREEEAHKEFRKQAKEAEGAYNDERDDKRNTLFPLFWSTIQIEHAAVYSNTPKPDVRKRYTDMQGPQKQMAQCIERALSYMVDSEDFAVPTHRGVNNFLVSGLGQCRVVYEAQTVPEPVINPATGQPVLDEETGQPMMSETLAYQTCRVEYFPWNRFRWEPSKDWVSCEWVSFDHLFTSEEIREQFGVELSGGEGGTRPDLPKNQQKYGQLYVVHEIWHKESRQILFICSSHGVPLDIRPDEYRLKDFFPCPAPLMDNVRPEEWTPTPDYKFVKAQFDYVNKITKRITSLTEQIKDVGFYDGGFPELVKIANAEDGTLVPVANLVDRLGKAGQKADFDNTIAKQNNDSKVQVVNTLINLRDQAKNAIFESLGISDILRGATKATETATAQQIKGQWASVRLTGKQQKTDLWFRDLFRIMAELIAEHFTAEQLFMMTGVQLTPDMMQALRSDVLRCYSIDIETDSTMAKDRQQDEQERAQFVSQFAQMVNSLVPAAMQNALPADFAKALLSIAAGSSKYGTQLEDAIEALPGSQQQMQQMGQQMQQAQQQAQQVQAQAQQQMAQYQKALDDAQKQLQQAAQANQELQAQVDQLEQVSKAAKAQLDQANASKAAADAQLTQIKAAKEAATPVVAEVPQFGIQ